jgi:hypothetical protein
MTKKALTLIIAAAVALIGLSLLCSGEAVAFADPLPFRLYAFVNKEGRKYFTEEEGVEIEIRCSKETEKVEYLFDFYADEEEKDEFTEFEEAETGPYKFAKLKVNKNGDLSLTAYIGGEEVDDFEVKVDCIDNAAPRLDKTKYPAPTREGSVLRWRAYITDNNFAKHSAASGIKKIVIFRYDKTAAFDPQKPLESLDKILERKVEREYTDYRSEVTLEFTMDKNGLYVVYMKDALGNYDYGIFGNYTEAPQYKVEITVNGIKTELNVDVAKYENYLKEGKGKVSPDILLSLENAIDNFVVAFRLEKSMEDKVAAYYVLKYAVEAYTSAKKEYKVDIVNPEFLDGRLYPLNLDGVAKLLGGDTLTLGLTATSYTFADIKKAFPDVVTLSGIGKPDRVIRISYTLTKNSELVKPDRPLIMHIEFPEDAEVALVMSRDKNKTFVQQTFIRDKNIVQFSASENSQEFYFVVKYNNKVPVGLIIGLSVGGAAVAAAGIATAVVITKKKKQAKKAIPPQDGGAEEANKPAEKTQKQKSTPPKTKREKSK